VRRRFVLALVVAMQGEDAAAADLPASGIHPVADQPAVERAILNGYRRYNASCSHCHGPDGVGSTFAPSLIERPLALEAFQEVVRNGQARGESVMRGFADDPNVAPHVGDIYALPPGPRCGDRRPGRPQATQGGPIRAGPPSGVYRLASFCEVGWATSTFPVCASSSSCGAVVVPYAPDRDHLLLSGQQEARQADRCT
jgi:cytochrome c553